MNRVEYTPVLMQGQGKGTRARGTTSQAAQMFALLPPESLLITLINTRNLLIPYKAHSRQPRITGT